MSADASPWARPEHVPCPDHGRSHIDAAGRCLPSCGHGWDEDSLLAVRDEAVAELHDGGDR